MAVFLARRLVVSVGVLLVATLLMYVLTATSGDPLEEVYTITNPADREARIRAYTENLQLDQPILLRWVGWLGGLAGYLLPGVDGTFGVNRTGADVAPFLENALAATLQLVTASVVVAAVTGITVGIVSALRQYSAFDYTLTLATFLFFSLPIFWVAILLKQYGAIGFNTWLADPVVSLPWLVALSSLVGVLAAMVLGGRTWRRRLLVLGVAAAATALVLLALSATRWFATPSLGLVGVPLLGLAAAVGVATLVAGLGRRRVLYASLAGAGVGIAVYYATLSLLTDPTWPLLLAVLAVTLVLAGVAGWLLGGLDKRQGARAAVLSGFAVAVVGFADWALFAWPDYSASVRGRPIATIGSNTPNYSGTFWETFLDTATHVLLPSIALVLISFAQYTRYTRSSMLEVMGQDYVRSARSKGLTERTVVMRHAFRNALIPVTTLMALDLAAVLGGAVVTERVFGWQGLGALFIEGLYAVDPKQVMGYFLVAGTAIVLFNIVADVLYAYLDPRIRLS